MSDARFTYSIAGTNLTVHGMRMDQKPKLGAKLVYSGNHLSYVDGKGKMFSTLVERGAYYYGTRWTSGRHLRIVRDAVTLGVVPKKAAVERLAKVEADRSKRREEGYAAQDALRSIRNAGITLTPAQTAALKRKAAAVRDR